MLHDIHTEPHAAAIIADLLHRFHLADPDDSLIEEALDYLAAARREHPEEQFVVVEICERAVTR